MDSINDKQVSAKVERQEPQPTFAGALEQSIVTLAAERGKPKPAVARAPLFSVRSIVILVTGLILGAVLGLGYWVISPPISPVANNQANSNGIFGFLKSAPTGPWASSVTIQVVSLDSSPSYLTELINKGQYYAALANSLPFRKYLREKLVEQGTQHNYTDDELKQMITVQYDSRTQPPDINITVTANTSSEAFLMAYLIPDVFRSYLIAEESKLQQDKYKATLSTMESVKTSLLDAEKERAALEQQEAASDITNDPEYVALNATVQALVSELDRHATNLAILIAQGDTSQAYTDNLSAVRRTSEALAEARKDLVSLQQELDTEDVALNVGYRIAQSRVDDLNRELTRLTDELRTLVVTDSSAAITDSLAVGTLSQPTLILPQMMRARDALIMGGIFGVGVAWVILNFRWIAKGMSSASREGKEEEDGEDKA
jgi:hypothetical protein